jgi:hypothetical protein
LILHRKFQLIALALISIFVFSNCKKKKKKKTTPSKTKKVKKCNCPKVRVCTTKEAIKALQKKTKRCLNWQKAYFKKTNPTGKMQPMEKREKYYTPVNPIGIITYIRDDETTACREVDLNGDGLIDLFYFFDSSGRNVMEIQQDSDYDGIIDHARIYRSGSLSIEKQNTDGIESTWELVKTYNNGKISQIASIVFNTQSNTQKVCNILNYFENFNSVGNLVSISYDNDCDGKIDLKINKQGRNIKNIRLTETDKLIKLKEEKPINPNK